MTKTASVRTTPIPRVRDLSPERFRDEYDGPQRPVVIEGGAATWPCARWTFELLIERAGKLPVRVMNSKSYSESDKEVIRFGDFLEQILLGTTGTRYLNQWSLTRMPDLDAELPRPYCNKNRSHVTRNLWVGPAGTCIGLHKDNHTSLDLINNIFCQVHGRKHVLLGAPDQDGFLYRRDEQASGHWHSDVDPRTPDYERFPLLREATLHECVIGPGDLLFVPGDYWHSFLSLDPSISVSAWWRVHRLTEIVVAALDGRGMGKLIEVPDVEEFGGIARLRLALDSKALPDQVRSVLLKRLSTAASQMLAEHDARIAALQPSTATTQS